MLHILVLLLLSSSNHSTYAIEHVQNCSSKDGCEVELKINVLLDLDNESTRITYQMCHNNTNPIELNSQSTYMSYEGQKIPNPFLHLNLTKCRTFTVTHKNETPQIRAASERTVSIQLDGSVTGKRCYCNLSKNITQIDVGASCGSTDSFLITEIVDPRHHPEDRFIEIFSAECKNKIIREDVKIEHTHNQEFSVSDVRVSLQNLRFDDNGFIVLCRTQNADLAYNVNCTMFRESFFSSEHVGTASYRIARYDNEGNDTVIDMYGEGIEVTNVNAHDFTEGRAVRKLCATAPSEEWNQQHWIIKAGANIEDSDPFRWGIQSPINCGPSSEPSSEPSSAPSSAPNISSSPSPDEIDDLIITEVATSYTNYLSFVELYAPSLKGRNIEENILLLRPFSDSLDGREGLYLKLQGLPIKEDGFLILCVNKYRFDKEFKTVCDHEAGDESIINSDGKNHALALVKGTFFPAFIDTCGKFDDSDTIYRAARKKCSATPNPKWGVSNWTISKERYGNKFDPGYWNASCDQ